MSTSRPNAADAYSLRLEQARASKSRLDHLGLVLANVRLATFLAALGLGVAAWADQVGSAAAWLSGGFALAFVAAAVFHDRVLARERRATQRVVLNERGLARLRDVWQDWPHRGESYLTPDHPYASDLDLFGPSSLFQRLDATATLPGEQTLARWLNGPASQQSILERQQAVRELAAHLDWRQDLEVEGRVLGAEKPDPSRLLAFAEAAASSALPSRTQALAVALPAATAALFLAGQLGLLPPRLWLAGVLAQLALLLLLGRRVRALLSAIMGPGERILRLGELYRVLERASQFQSPALAALSARLRGSGAPPSVEMRRLDRALSFLRLREQPLFHLPLNLLVLWDLHFACAVERWQKRCGARVRAWVEALGEAEALGSLAGFCFEHPDYAFPEVVPDRAELVAQALGHPLIPADRRVANDVSLPGPGRALLVTGSNMAGKTTLLRTLGVNTVLALAGAPVCARALRVGRVQVCTSMRVRDSLAQGVSFFYAEVKRIKGVLDAAAAGPILFLLDEVLQGTNTAERQLASRAIVRRLVDLGAMGAIATHDLGLTTLEAETGGRVVNVHFTDQIVGGEMTFDYRLRPGVVATTNALALLERAGILLDVAPLAAAPARTPPEKP